MGPYAGQALVPDVSVVLVAYNRASFIQRTLESIARQTYPAFEVLICDDCSTDSTESICRAFAESDSRFTYFRNESNVRMPANLNRGLRQAQCEFVAIMHDGDIYAPQTIEKWRTALLTHPTAGFVFNRYRHLSPDGQSGVVTGAFPELMRGHEFLEWCFRDRELECPAWGTVMLRRSLLQTLGYFDERYSFWSDVDMWFRIAANHDVAHVPEALIDLPHRLTVPHLFDNAFNTGAHRHMFLIYWAWKKRHYRGQPLRMSLALSNQVFGFTAALGARAVRKLSRRTAPMVTDAGEGLPVIK